MTHAEWALSALEGHGLDPVTMLDVHALLYCYVEGVAVNLERETQAAAATGLSGDEWIEQQAAAFPVAVDETRRPALFKVFKAVESADGYDLRLDALFTLGLTSLLDGLAAVVERPAS
ncbi:hypothetical protein Pth03_05500 [Planotetraspora thailandica]|uniref:Tetracycline repressor TetR C-terminal domain-containing protein n=2 Tax=Planotetraspora thailandica TaxID=487172 RepID=A0A8J3XU06_9ACTN|nr:hypothetical protein Pth03_05500 [Planotetraspora thailandica]